MKPVPHGEPYAGKLHVRFDEGAGVPHGASRSTLHPSAPKFLIREMSHSRVTFVILPATLEQHGDRNFVRAVISFRRLMLKRPFYNAFVGCVPADFKSAICSSCP